MPNGDGAPSIESLCGELCGGYSDLAKSSWWQAARDGAGTAADTIGTVGQAASGTGDLMGAPVEIMESTAEGTALAGPLGTVGALGYTVVQQFVVLGGDAASLVDDTAETLIGGANTKSSYEDYQLYEALAAACEELCSKEETWRNRNSEQLQELISTITELKAQIDQLQSDNDGKDEKIEQLSAEYTGLRQSTSELENRVDELERQMEELKKQFDDRENE